jgi:Flp pilus assembly protein CpaB
MRPKPPVRRRLRPGLLLRRRPRLRLALVGALALVVGLSVGDALRQAERAEAAWGVPRMVVVVTGALAPGDLVTDAHTDRLARPAAVVPAGAITVVPDGARVAAAVGAGEILLDRHLAPAGTTALTARLPRGTRAIGIPSEPGTTPPLEVGDTVDVLVALAPETAGSGPPGFALAEAAVVIHVAEAAVTVAVPTADAPRVAVALAQGAVTLALAPPT